MLSTIDSFRNHATRLACVAFVCSGALLGGCASGNVSNVSSIGTASIGTASSGTDSNASVQGAMHTANASLQVRPDNIYVYTFDGDPTQVKLDKGGALKKLTSQFGGTSDADKQAADAAAVREQVANEIVHQLQAMGLRAIRSDIPAPADQNVLLVQGSFDSIDAGNRRRRMLIGFGAGKSEVTGSVQILYKPAGGTARVVQTFDANADSGKAPGMAATAGVGAAAGSIATTAAVGGGVHAVSETKRAGVSADAKRFGDAVARQIAQIGVSGGWLSAEHVKGS